LIQGESVSLIRQTSHSLQKANFLQKSIFYHCSTTFVPDP
jgi:hypothetical protein